MNFPSRQIHLYPSPIFKGIQDEFRKSVILKNNLSFKEFLSLRRSILDIMYPEYSPQDEYFGEANKHDLVIIKAEYGNAQFYMLDRGQFLSPK